MMHLSTLLRLSLPLIAATMLACSDGGDPGSVGDGSAGSASSSGGSAGEAGGAGASAAGSSAAGAAAVGTAGAGGLAAAGSGAGAGGSDQGAGGTAPTGSATGADGAAACTTDTWAGFAQAFFQDNCTTGCHKHSFGKSSPDHATIQGEASSVSEEISSGDMPPGGGLSASDQARILTWLSCGSPM